MEMEPHSVRVMNDYPGPRFPRYLLQERARTVEELLPIARHHIRQRYSRSGLGDVKKGDKILIVTYPDQNLLVMEAIKTAMYEAGAERVDAIDIRDLGMEVGEYSAADGWREAVDRVIEMTEYGAEYRREAEALKRFLQDRPGYTAVYVGESGRTHWRRVTGGPVRGNWLYTSYEAFISRAQGFPDELYRLIDLKVLEFFKHAAAVHITDPQGTDISWKVTPEQAALWPKGAYITGHILGSTIQAIRFAHPVQTFLEQAKILLPTLNGVIAGTSNHTGFFSHIEVHVEGGMIKKVVGGGRYGEAWRAIIERYKDVQYPGFPYKGWAYFNDCSIGTNPKGHRHIEGLWKTNFPTTNLPERIRAGVIHFGFGAEHWDPEFIKYARENKLPTMHFPHVHNIFPTFEILRRDTGEWVKLIDKGRLTVLDDPDVRRLTETVGGPELLEYDWIPALPGINYPGDYGRDYAQDPVSWIRRDQAGEFDTAQA